MRDVHIMSEAKDRARNVPNTLATDLSIALGFFGVFL